MAENVDIPDVSNSGENDDGFDFYGKIDTLVDGLDLPQKCFESSADVCSMVRGVDDFKYSFTSFGGYDAVVCLSVFLGVRQEGCPVPAQVVVDFVEGSPEFELSSNFSADKLNQLARKFKKILHGENEGFEPVFVTAEDYVKFYSNRFDFPVNQEELEEELDVSQVAVRYTYKEVVEGLTGLDTSHKALNDVEVMPSSFGFYGDSVEDFALHLLEKVEEQELDVRSKSPRVLAASVLYVAGKLI